MGARRREHKMNKEFKVGLIFALLVVVAILAAFWVIVVRLPQFPGIGQHRTPPPSFIPGDYEFFYVANTIISSVNIALLLVLIVLYTDIYVKTRSPFSLGLVIFALVFFVKDVTSSPFVSALYGYRAYGLGPFAFLPSLFEFVALSILLYLSIRY
jgi:hypothetical protein